MEAEMDWLSLKIYIKRAKALMQGKKIMTLMRPNEYIVIMRQLIK